MANGGQGEAAAAQQEKKFPHKYDDILKNFSASARIDTSSPAKVKSELAYPGIFDKPQKRRYWVHEDGHNCFMLHAKALTITWGGTSYYWRWYPEKLTAWTSEVSDVAELLDICWLEAYGTFEIGYLTPETLYEVSYVIMLKYPNYGWEDEVNFSLTLPKNLESTPITPKLDLRKLPKGRWSYVRVAQFKTLPGQSGRMEFRLRQFVGKWKKGLVIKGVDISPK